MTTWQLTSLEMDYPGERIGKFLEQKLNLKKRVRFSSKEHVEVNKKAIRKIISNCLNIKDGRPLTFMGSGNYHHYTYGICYHLGKIHQDYGYIHIDQHTDHANPLGYEGIKNGEVTCGSFVPSLLSDTNARALLLVGSYLGLEDHKQIKGIDYWEIDPFNKKDLRQALKSFPKKVYLSFDLDVMQKRFIYTSWGNHNMTLKDVYYLINEVKKTKKIIGADILGYGDIYGKKAGKQLYLQIANALMK